MTVGTGGAWEPGEGASGPITAEVAGARGYLLPLPLARGSPHPPQRRGVRARRRRRKFGVRARLLFFERLCRRFAGVLRGVRGFGGLGEDIEGGLAGGAWTGRAPSESRPDVEPPLEPTLTLGMPAGLTWQGVTWPPPFWARAHGCRGRGCGRGPGRGLKQKDLIKIVPYF